MNNTYVQVGEILSASIDSRLLSVLTTTVQHIGGKYSYNSYYTLA
jgi:hypothetical protein